MHRTSGVTAQQRMILRIVGHLGTVGAGTLSALLHVHPGTLSAALRRLEGVGCSRASARKRRGRSSSPSRPGRAALKTSEGAWSARASVLDGSDAASVEHALQLLEQMTRTLEAQLAERREVDGGSAGGERRRAGMTR
jgi:DNA-binding MarR family transcriptional regulator